MNCPPEIADVVLELIQTALLRIRAAGWTGDSARCAIEADHVHNLPTLLTNYSPELLHYYWDVERRELLHALGAEQAGGYSDLWDRLSVYVEDTLSIPN
jgi:hypothetical protein